MSITLPPSIPGAGYTGNVGGPVGPAATDGAKGAAANEQLSRSLLAFIGQNGDKGTGALPAPQGALTQHASAAYESLAKLSADNVSTDIYAVMALFQKMAQEQRNAAREVRATEMNAQIDSLKGAADQIRAAAQDRFVGAVVAGSLQIAGGVASITAGTMAFKSSMSAASANVGSGQAKMDASNLQAANLDGSMPELAPQASYLGGKATYLEGVANQHSGKAQLYNSIGQGSSGIAGGIGQIAQAAQEKKAAEHDAQKAELEAQAKVHDSGVQQANDLMQQMMDVIRDVRDKLGSMEQSRLETNRGIARNI